MKKKILGLMVIISFVLVHAKSALAMKTSVNESDDKEQIWYNPINSDASGNARRTTIFRLHPHNLAIPIGLIIEGTLLDDLGRTIDLNGVEWIKVRRHDELSKEIGYIKASDFNIHIY